MPQAKKARAQRASEAVTQAEYARIRKVSREAVRKAVVSGRIPTFGPRKLIDPRTADRALRVNSDPSKVRKPGTLAPRKPRDDDEDGSGIPSYYQSKRKHEYQKARLAEIEVMERLQQLLPAAPVREACHRRDRRVRDQLTAVADRLAPLLVGNTDQLDVHRKITAEMRAICENLAGPEPIIQEAIEETIPTMPDAETA